MLAPCATALRALLRLAFRVDVAHRGGLAGRQALVAARRRARREVRSEFARNYPPTINTTSFSSPVYTVPAHQRRVPVRLVGSRVAYGGALKATLARGVPLPRAAQVAAGSDKHLVVWQPATDTMWELWVAEKTHGTWTAQWGGKMTGVSRNRGFFFDPSGIQPGATATSLPLVGGMITQADLARGEINHALAMAIPNARYAVWAYPAQRSDGGNRSRTRGAAGSPVPPRPRGGCRCAAGTAVHEDAGTRCAALRDLRP